MMISDDVYMMIYDIEINVLVSVRVKSRHVHGLQTDGIPWYFLTKITLKLLFVQL